MRGNTLPHEPHFRGRSISAGTENNNWKLVPKDAVRLERERARNMQLDAFIFIIAFTAVSNTTVKVKKFRDGALSVKRVKSHHCIQW